MLTGKGLDGIPDAASRAEPEPREHLSRPSTGPRARHRRAVLLRSLVVLAWIGVGVALFVLLERISLRGQVTADGASNALQGWEMLHGNLLLHGWVLDDATYYTFELPLYMITESLVGLHTVDTHVVGALTFLIVAALATMLARAGSRGLAAAGRSAIVIAVLAAPLVLAPGVAKLVAEPNHFGTSVFLFGSFLLIDKAATRWFTAPLVCVILCVGQIGDVTVRYVAVPAIVVVCAYHVLAARRLRTHDMAVAVARAVMLYFGSNHMVLAKTRFGPIGQWPHHAVQTVVAAIKMFGGAPGQPFTMLAVAAAVFILACVLAAVAGFMRAVWNWRTASRAEQMLCTAIVVYLAAFVVSTYAVPREIAAVLPCGAVLAARACVPGNIVSLPRARAVFAAAVLAAVLPLATAAARPLEVQEQARVAAWLDAHGFRYGLAWFGNASTVTVQSGGRVQVRAVQSPGHWHPFGAGYRQAKADWYNPSLHRATFVIAGKNPSTSSIRRIERFFGRPAAIYYVAGWVIVNYRKNLLVRVATVRQAIQNWPANG